MKNKKISYHEAAAILNSFKVGTKFRNSQDNISRVLKIDLENDEVRLIAEYSRIVYTVDRQKLLNRIYTGYYYNFSDLKETVNTNGTELSAFYL